MAGMEQRTADRVTALTAAVQAAFLIGYAVVIAYLLVSRGPEGPEEVASGPGVAAEVVTFALFGAGVVVVAVGRWNGRSWSTVPFVVVQLLTLTVSFPLILGQANETGARIAGAVATFAALIGLGALIVGRASGSETKGNVEEK
ncbi:MAG: hypothetical protein CMH41_02590 [Micrococcales bacterium]|nr:hypothetical protein [Micrococcales bacterium]